MAEAYSKEFRRDVLAACDSGECCRDVANRFSVSESWIRRIKQQRRELGKIAPCRNRKRTPKWAVYTDQILEIYSARPDTTLTELKAELGTELSRSTLCIAVQRLKLTYKKKFSSLRSNSGKTSR